MEPPFRNVPGIQYRDVIVEGVRIAYREAGPPDAPAVLLLHGVPSSSRMFDGLVRLLGDRYRAVALDYPGFGNSEVPSRSKFIYSFEHLAEIVAHFTDALALDGFGLFMQDYGAPIGMRLALARPSAIQGMIFQNGNVYAEGLGEMWAHRRAYWADRAAHEAEIRATHLSLAATRGRHVGSDPRPEAYNPDLWMDELAYLHRPGIAEVQMDLIHDYRTNIESYPSWQNWLRVHHLPTLVIWGRHDLAFTVSGATAFQRDLPDAAIHILEAGHFAMDTQLDQVALLTRGFLDRLYGRNRRQCRETQTKSSSSSS